MHCSYGGDEKLLTCRNAAGLTAAKLAAKHGHSACAQQLTTLRKLGVGGAARLSRAAAAADAGGGGYGGRGSDAVGPPPIAVVTLSGGDVGDEPTDMASAMPAVAAPAVSVVPSIMETAAAAAGRTVGVVTPPGDVGIVAAARSTLPTARTGKQRLRD